MTPAEWIAGLGIRRGDRVALVGAGGKTGLALQLVAEARARGWTSLFSTTTRVLAPPERDEPFIVVGDSEPDLPLLHRQLRRSGHLFLARRWLQEWDETPAGRQQKVGGFAPEEIDRLAAVLQPDLVVTEADGSRHQSFKAPAPYEPVVPVGTTLLVVLAGLSVLGRPLDAAWVHRPERVAELAQAPMGTRLDAALVADVLAHPEGGRKGAPPAARQVALLAQATAERRPVGREIARRLLRRRAFERIVLGDLDDPAARVEVWPGRAVEGVRRGTAALPPVCAVVLAAGMARRMGQNKLLLPLGNRPLVAHAVDAAIGSLAGEVWVVLGAEARAVRRALGTRPLRFLLNRRWAEGQSSSLRRALAALPRRTEGVLFLAGDMPFVPPAHLDRMIERFRTGGADIVWSEAGSRRMVPALFGRSTFPALAGLMGDLGGRALAGTFGSEATVTVPSPDLLNDIDTPEAYEQAQRWQQWSLSRG